MKRKVAAIGFATLSLLAAIAGTTATQTPTIPVQDGVYAVTRLSDQSEPGLLSVTTPSGPRWAQVGVRVEVAIPSVRSMNNANTQYSIDYSYIAAGPCGASLLRVDGEWRFQERSSLTSLAANARGSTLNGCMVHTEVADPSQQLGNRIASVLGTTPLLWVVTGDRVTGTFTSAKSVFHVGEDIEILFTMNNPSDAPLVQRMSLGRDKVFGPGWGFQIRRDGVAISPLGRGGSVGGTTVDFSPNETVIFRIPLRDWSNDVNKPGHYVVVGTHTERFSPSGRGIGNRSPGGDQQFTGAVEFDIQP